MAKLRNPPKRNDPARVVLVKPGDVLVIGNVGQVDPLSLPPLCAELKEQLGLASVVVFSEDIDLARVPRG